MSATASKVDWDSALARTTKYLPTVEAAIRGWTFSHPSWYVRAELGDFPPAISIRCLLRQRGRTKRSSTGVNIGGMGAKTVNVIQALTPTDDELREIADFIATLATTEFTPRRAWYTEDPWVTYELKVDYGRYER